MGCVWLVLRMGIVWELCSGRSPFVPTTVGEVQNKSRTDVFMTVPRHLGLYPLTEIFSRGIHRVPVVDGEGRIEAVVSQSALLRFLARHMSEQT